MAAGLKPSVHVARSLYAQTGGFPCFTWPRERVKSRHLAQGKSSLLKAFSGLWRDGTGALQTPEGSFFIPQKPFVPRGSLEEALCYPRAAGSETRERLGVGCRAPDQRRENRNKAAAARLAKRLAGGASTPEAAPIASARSREGSGPTGTRPKRSTRPLRA